MIAFALVSVTFALSLSTNVDAADRSPINPFAVDAVETSTPPLSSATSTPAFSINLPLIYESGPPPVELLDAWTSNAEGKKLHAFLPGEILAYTSEGMNNLNQPIDANFELIQFGPSGETLIYSDTLTLDPGPWQQSFLSTTQIDTGVYTTTTRLTYEYHKKVTSSLATYHVVNPPSGVITYIGHGFDRCYIPTVEQMGTWWDKSPYSVFNLYIGGIHFACDDQPLDAVWVQEVARQGWKFILTWVGPQAPCTGFKYRMSWNKEAAYIQGKIEALGAAEAALNLGFLGDQVIFYDVEGYSADSSCRTAVSSFMLGWTEQLNELGIKAGGYGSPCRSYIADWANNDPPPEDVWIAHWSYPTSDWNYDSQATVFGAPCLDDDLWANHRRIKQYTGGHKETWGGVDLTIDSNVLDGEITALEVPASALATNAQPDILNLSGPPIREMDLLSPTSGWVLTGDRLLLTMDGGAEWQDVTPQGLIPLDAAFNELFNAWVVGWHAETAKLAVARSTDGGFNWQSTPLLGYSQDDLPAVEAAYLNVLDENTAWAALKLPSSSSFSLGRLFVTQDGGQTWQERSLPTGAAVLFLDALNGWTAGGAAGNQLYHTQDGGFTWQLQGLELQPGVQATVGLPHFSDRENGWLPVAVIKPDGTRLELYTTQDGGRTWGQDTTADTLVAGEPISLSAEIFVSALPEQADSLVTVYQNLPSDTVLVKFNDDLHGWATIQQGSCQGDKSSASAEPLTCQQTWQLLATEDGGRTWREITPISSFTQLDT